MMTWANGDGVADCMEDDHDAATEKNTSSRVVYCLKRVQ